MAIEVPWGINCMVSFPVVIGTIVRDAEQTEALLQIIGHIVQEAGRRAHIQQRAEEEGLTEVSCLPDALRRTVIIDEHL